MNLTDFETFLMIAKTKSITKSAENLFVTQPTVSHRLKSLENQLNVKLVVRNKGFKTVELTRKGEEFVAIAEQWRTLWKDLNDLQHKTDKLFLTIGCIDTLNATLMAPFYQKMLDSNPPINLNIRTHQSFEIYNLLERNEIDIGIVFHNLYFKNVISEPLFKEPLYLVQPKEGCVDKKSINLFELDTAKELYFMWDDNYRIWHDQWIKRNDHFTIQVDSFNMLLTFMCTGKYWMITPISVIAELVKHGAFHVSRIANKPSPPDRVTYRIRHKTPRISTERAVQKFDELLKPYLEEVEMLNRAYIEELL